MNKKRAVKRTSVMTEEEKAAQKMALQTTLVLKGTLKRVQLMYLRVGELLVKVRDEKLYAALKYVDMESYASERLGRASR